ncbi:MAG: arsenite methyltransferase [bacterium]
MSQNSNIQNHIRKHYSKIAKANNGCCCNNSCCSPERENKSQTPEEIGYTIKEINTVPKTADMGLGCGNPHAIADLKPGETVIDLGCGGGLDCFLAAKKVGKTGKVIGIDMTAEMINKARENARKGNFSQVEFKLGKIESLPLNDNCADVIISNCVINLSPDKSRTFNEAYRVLRPGGRIAVSDIVSVIDLPEEIKNNHDALCGCIAGAAGISDLETLISQAGFQKIVIKVKENSQAFIKDWFPDRGYEQYVRSAIIHAVKN